MSFQEIENSIINNPKWNSCMDAIDSLTVDNTENHHFMCEHGRGHALRVVDYAQKFLEDLGESKETVALGKIACLLHDISLENGEKANHSYRSADQAKEYLEDTDMDDNSKEMVYHAIKFHSDGEELNNNIDAALLLGDKLDVSHERVITGISLNALCKELLKIKKIEYQLQPETAILQYNVEPDFNYQQLHDWGKSITIPYKVAHFLNREFRFRVNDKDLTDFVNEAS